MAVFYLYPLHCFSLGCPPRNHSTTLTVTSSSGNQPRNPNSSQLRRDTIPGAQIRHNFVGKPAQEPIHIFLFHKMPRPRPGPRAGPRAGANLGSVPRETVRKNGTQKKRPSGLLGWCPDEVVTNLGSEFGLLGWCPSFQREGVVLTHSPKLCSKF